MPANGETEESNDPTAIADTEVRIDQEPVISRHDHSTIPAALSNPTLGAAARGVFLDVMDAQLAENRAAEIEGRPARIAKRDNRHPGWTPPNGISSLHTDVTFGTHFDDGEPVIAPQGGPEIPASGLMLSARERLGVTPDSPPGGLKGDPAPDTDQGGTAPQNAVQTPSRAPKPDKGATK